MSGSQILLEVKHLKVYFPIRVKVGLFRTQTIPLKAVDDVSFSLRVGETLGVVGESGCGKSTLGRAILGLAPVNSGEIVFEGHNVLAFNAASFRPYRKKIQMIFQDPLASLDPRMTIGQIISEPLKTFYPEYSRAEIEQQVYTIMEEVGLLPEQVNRYPHEFSGGQCQRIGIARALILKPEVIICDEAVSALDVSIQAQIINLLMKLQKKYGLSLIFIAHDLSVVRHISNKVMVMYLGRMVESADSEEIYRYPQHPYTQALLAAIPVADPQIERQKKQSLLHPELPSPLRPPSGCRFRTRCHLASARCAEVDPPLLEYRTQHFAACHLMDAAMAEGVGCVGRGLSKKVLAKSAGIPVVGASGPAE